MGQKCPILTKDIMIKYTLLVAALALLVGCSEDKKPKEVVKAEAAQAELAASEPVAATEPTPTVDQKITTWLRSRPHSIQICYDPAREGMYIQYPPLPSDADPADPPFHDWIYMEKLPMYYIATNNTWYLAEADINKIGFAQVFPDVTGLTCKINVARQT